MFVLQIGSHAQTPSCNAELSGGRFGIILLQYTKNKVISHSYKYPVFKGNTRMNHGHNIPGRMLQGEDWFISLCYMLLGIDWFIGLLYVTRYRLVYWSVLYVTGYRLVNGFVYMLLGIDWFIGLCYMLLGIDWLMGLCTCYTYLV